MDARQPPARAGEGPRSTITTWGLAKDEFTDTDNWPHQLYVREARRMIGDYVMTEHELPRAAPVAEDSVGLAAYTMDSHNIQRYVTPDGHVRNEGDVQVGGFPPVPDLLPLDRAEGGGVHEPARAGLPVGVAHRLRLDPHGAGVHGPRPVAPRPRRVHGDRRQGATCRRSTTRSCGSGCSKDKQVLDWTGPKRQPAAIDPKKLAGIVVDDAAAERQGLRARRAARPARSSAPATGTTATNGPRQAVGHATARICPQPGKYEVRLSLLAESEPGDQRAGDDRPRRRHDGREGQPAGRRRRSTGAFVSLGTFRFEKGKTGYVEIGNKDADGYVIIDAVQWLPVKE